MSPAPTSDSRKPSPIAVAVVGGTGYWGAFYMRAFARSSRCRIVALVDTAAERRRQFQDHYAIPASYDSTARMLSEVRPDIVSIILPVSASFDAVLACAEGNVPVVTCEKPIAGSLSKADSMVSRCEERGTRLSCGTALWEIRDLDRIGEWARSGAIGRFLRASIPCGLHAEVSGRGCVPLCFLRFLTGLEVEWVEGSTTPETAAFDDADCNAYGRLGLSGGLVCDIPSPGEVIDPEDGVALQGETGEIRLNRTRSSLIQGAGERACPVFPPFLQHPEDEDPSTAFFDRVVASFVDLFDGGGKAPCSGHDYRQALEIAVALKLSARQGHRRIHLPLAERDHVILPIPYRMYGGDVTGWTTLGLEEPRILD